MASAPHETNFQLKAPRTAAISRAQLGHISAITERYVRISAGSALRCAVVPQRDRIDRRAHRTWVLRNGAFARFPTLGEYPILMPIYE